MLTFYLCFLAGGAVLPLINVIAGFLSHGMDTDIDGDIDVDADVDLDVDIDTDLQIDSDPDMEFHHPVAADSAHSSAMDHPGTGTESLFSVGLLPTSLLSISGLAIIFGASGALMTLGNRNRILSLILSVIFGYLASVLVQTIINSLKRAQTINNGINENELLLYDGKVIDTILPGQLGTVSFVTLKDVRVSYPARCEDMNLKLETGRIVKAKEFRNGIFIVEPKNKYEE